MSETKKTDDIVEFSVQILFSETLEFTLDEIAQAVSEDFPEAAVTVPGEMPAEVIKTDGLTLGIFQPTDPANGRLVTMTGLGVPDENFRAADHTELAWRSGPGFAQAALDAIKSHQSYLGLSISTTDTSLTGRYRAARQLTSIAAVFAGLPIALGVLVQWTGHMVAPAAWVKSAHEAAKGEWPLPTWIAYRGGWDAAHGTQSQYAVAYTIGLTQFLDFEFHLEPAPILPSDAIKMLFGACWLPLEGGSAYRDGDTMGVEGSDLRYTMRRRKTDDGAEAAIMSLLHPESPVDEESIFGPNPLMKAPKDFDNERMGKPGFMSRLLGKRQTIH